jgi:hypothetical protein
MMAFTRTLLLAPSFFNRAFDMAGRGPFGVLLPSYLQPERCGTLLLRLSAVSTKERHLSFPLQSTSDQSCAKGGSPSNGGQCCIPYKVDEALDTWLDRTVLPGPATRDGRTSIQHNQGPNGCNTFRDEDTAADRLLHVLANNLTRVMNIIGIEPLTVAMRA